MKWLLLILAAYAAAFCITYVIVRGMESLMTYCDGKEKKDMLRIDRLLLAIWTPVAWFKHEHVFERDDSLMYFMLNENAYVKDRASVRFALLHAAFAGLLLALGMVTRLISLIVIALGTSFRRRRWAQEAQEAERAQEERRLASRTYGSRRQDLERSFTDVQQVRAGLEELEENLNKAIPGSESEEDRILRHDVSTTLATVRTREEGLRTKLWDLDAAKDKLEQHKTYCALLTKAGRLLSDMQGEPDCDSPGHNLKDEIAKLTVYVEETMNGAELLLAQQSGA